MNLETALEYATNGHNVTHMGLSQEGAKLNKFVSFEDGKLRIKNYLWYNQPYTPTEDDKSRTDWGLTKYI